MSANISPCKTWYTWHWPFCWFIKSSRGTKFLSTGCREPILTQRCNMRCIQTLQHDFLLRLCHYKWWWQWMSLAVWLQDAAHYLHTTVDEVLPTPYPYSSAVSRSFYLVSLLCKHFQRERPPDLHYLSHMIPDGHKISFAQSFSSSSSSVMAPSSSSSEPGGAGGYNWSRSRLM